MKYYVENNLTLFEFHDSVISLVRYDETNLIVSAKQLNIRKFTEQNPSEYDMEIADAQITFYDFTPLSYIHNEVLFADTETTPLVSQKTFEGKDATEHFLEELNNQITIFDFNKMDNGNFFIDGIGIGPFFTMIFSFAKVTIEWESYIDKSVYEQKKQYRYPFTLSTPTGDIQTEFIINCHKNNSFSESSIPSVYICCKYDEKEYCGYGNDYLWIDAFADLQKKLPEGIYIKSCLTCRHGNLCPVGNCVNEVFCTKDVTITQKSDLFFYTEDWDERDKRSRQYACLCEDFQPQTGDYYTYNDYIYELNK